MKRANDDIRHTAQSKGIYLWQVAERYGVSDSNFSRLLRRELPKDKRQKIFQIINDLAGNEATGRGAQ